MEQQVIQFSCDGSSKWAGMSDYILVSPNNVHRIELRYIGEPPHGDSYHQGIIDDIPFPGLIWGCMFAFSSCSRYFVFSWMTKLVERVTVAVDLQERLYFKLPDYIYNFTVKWPKIEGQGTLDAGKGFTFSDSEKWMPYVTAWK